LREIATEVNAQDAAIDSPASVERSEMSSALTVLIGVFLFVGVPLLGWGAGDVWGFFCDSARALYAMVSVILSLWVVTSIPNAGHSRGIGRTVVRRQHIALVLIQILSVAVVVVGPVLFQESTEPITSR
jgi:hypothetical protein